MVQLRCVFLLSLAAVLAFVSAQSNPAQAPSLDLLSDEELKAVVIRMERTHCYGSCPAYTLTIYGDGRVEYVSKEKKRGCSSKTRHDSPQRGQNTGCENLLMPNSFPCPIICWRNAPVGNAQIYRLPLQRSMCRAQRTGSSMILDVAAPPKPSLNWNRLLTRLPIPNNGRAIPAHEALSVRHAFNRKVQRI